MIRRSDWLAITRDRVAVLLFLTLIFGTIVILATTIARIHPSDIQVPVRFTGYGQSNIDRDHWYTQIAFGLFGVLVVIINGFLAAKLHAISRILSLGIIAMSIFILILALIVANAVFNLAPSV